MTDKKFYVPVVILSFQNTIKILKQLDPGFKRIVNWNKYQSTLTQQASNRYLHYLIDPSFQEVNRLFALSFENKTDRDVHTCYYLPKIKMNYYNVIIDRKNLFDQPVKNNLGTYDNIRKIANGQGDNYRTSCLLDSPYFEKYYKLIAIDLSKQQILNADPKEIQQVNFTGNLSRGEGATIFFHY